MSIFVTGTDTGVGKTSFTVWLLQELRARGVRCAGYKPICCGDRDDAVQLHAAGSPGLTIGEVNPVWLRTPAAPLTAARAEKRVIDLPSLREGFSSLEARVDFVVVEGVGGWMVPITPDYFSSHLAAELALPVVVVAQNRLGCLNHVLLTVRALEAAGLRCAGVVLNDFAQESDVAMLTNAEILRSCLAVPIVTGFGSDLEPLLQMMPEIRRLF
ncbi:MAG: dethiobiotin synthase [Verrucomicrobiota bacterium]|nr:dethiobiotin synthase [Verrucomicrobiota bacterium]